MIDVRAVDVRAVVRGALFGLVVIVPVSVLYALLDRAVDDFDDSGWAALLVVAIVLAYVVAGLTAGRIASAAPLSNGALAGLGALVLWLPLRVLIWAVREASNGLLTGDDPVLGPSRILGQCVLAAVFGLLGALIARRGRRADAGPA